MWKEFEDQLIRETRTSITMSFDVSERITKRAIKECVPKWKDRLGQNPRKVIYEGDGYSDGEWTVDYAYCPNCDHETEVDSENWGCSYCPECGQRLDWEVEHKDDCLRAESDIEVRKPCVNS